MRFIGVGLSALLALAATVTMMHLPATADGGGTTTLPTPPPFLVNQAAGHVLMVFSAVPSDAPTSSKIAVEAAGQLKTAIAMTKASGTARILPLPMFGLSDYTTACWQAAQFISASNPSGGPQVTVGSLPPVLVIIPPATQSAANNYILGTRNWTRAEFIGVLYQCDTLHGVPTYAWSSEVHGGVGSINNISLLGIAAGLAGINALNTKAASTQTTTTATYATPTPAPTPLPSGAPTPAPSYTSSVVTQTTNSSNQNTPNTVLIGSTVLSALGVSGSASNLPAIGSTSADRPLAVAIAGSVKGLVAEIMSQQATICIPGNDVVCEAIFGTAAMTKAKSSVVSSPP